MPKPPEFYWPLASLSGSSEIRDYFPEEAELLGVISILWNRQELALRQLYLQILASKRPAYAEAIWDQQSTHQARRNLLALALVTVKLTKRQRIYLDYIIERTKLLADRRNELLHAEYVVHGKTERLHAKVKPPRSTKPPKHQPATTKHLEIVVRDLDDLLQTTEGAWLAFLTRKEKWVQKSLDRLAKHLQRPPESPQSGSGPQSPRQTADEEPPPPPQSSEA
jgi:hypothetical protein